MSNDPVAVCRAAYFRLDRAKIEVESAETALKKAKENLAEFFLANNRRSAGTGTDGDGSGRTLALTHYQFLSPNNNAPEQLEPLMHALSL